VKQLKLTQKKLIISSNLKSLDQDSIDNIKNIFNRYKGEKPIGFEIYHPEDKIKITLNSRKQKVDVCNDLLDELDLASLKYRIK